MATTTGFTGQRARPARNARYLLVCTASLAVWYGLNFWPGWQSIPVLTAATDNVISLVNLWLLATAVSSAVYIVFDAAWFKSACQILVTATGVAAAARVYVEFPFDFSGLHYYDVRWIARLALTVAVIGGLLRLIVVGIRFVRAAVRAMDDYLWTRQVRSTIEAKSAMAALARPMSDSHFTSDSIARTVAGDPATNTLARFAQLGGVLEDEPAPAADTSSQQQRAEAGETRRSRRAAHASSAGSKVHLPRFGHRKAGSHAAH